MEVCSKTGKLLGGRVVLTDPLCPSAITWRACRTARSAVPFAAGMIARALTAHGLGIAALIAAEFFVCPAEQWLAAGLAF